MKTSDAEWDRVFDALNPNDYCRPIDVKRAILSVDPTDKTPLYALWPICTAWNHYLALKKNNDMKVLRLRHLRKVHKTDRQSRFQKQRQIKALGIPI